MKRDTSLEQVVMDMSTRKLRNNCQTTDSTARAATNDLSSPSVFNSAHHKQNNNNAEREVCMM